ncbi:MAG: hypothetical protein II774_02480 [Lachnospiraceae bacterium]|nr:hypothetical protein [Lachnospiraceae bacterium]
MVEVKESDEVSFSFTESLGNRNFPVPFSNQFVHIGRALLFSQVKAPEAYRLKGGINIFHCFGGIHCGFVKIGDFCCERFDLRF